MNMCEEGTRHPYSQHYWALMPFPCLPLPASPLAPHRCRVQAPVPGRGLCHPFAAVGCGIRAEGSG